MKATNSFWKNFEVEWGAVIPKKYQTRPPDHENFEWQSQDGHNTNIKKLDDMHLANIYRMLVKSLAYYEDVDDLVSLLGGPNGEMAMDMYLSELGEISGQISFIEYCLERIAYEIHIRGLFINKFNKSENVAT